MIDPTCELCKDACRGHRLGHPEEWTPEQGSSAQILRDAGRLADAMVGQCMETLEDCMERLGIEDTIEVRREFDSLAFECAGCNWWCEAGEANANPSGDGDVCDDCKEED